MASAYDSLLDIVGGGSTASNKLIAIQNFARQLQWSPSFEISGNYGAQVSEDHLVVEHGLDTSAVISFLKQPHRAVDLAREQLDALLSISYNNLVDWHIFVSDSDVRIVHNRDPQADINEFLSRSNCAEKLSSLEVVSKFQRNRFSDLGLACDEVLVRVIGRWKKLLQSDLGSSVNNHHLSTLFNSIIFARGCEDMKRATAAGGLKSLSEFVDENQGENLSIANTIETHLAQYNLVDGLKSIVDMAKLAVFDQMDKGTARDLFRDFYRPANSPFPLNFALLSKHALSRIYEKYVALLQLDENPQQSSFFNSIAVEQKFEKTASIYTPQFVAGFFVRYLRDNTTPRSFRELSSIDPACGSGIFLRTLLEQQCNPLNYGVTPQSIATAFANVAGIDIDANACEATKLSLSLLHLLSTGSLPLALNIQNTNAIESVLLDGIAVEHFDVVLANPPYIKLDDLQPDQRAIYKNYLGDDFTGRIDSYLAFLKWALDSVKPGGFVCLVLPQAFLTARNGNALRKRIAKEFNVRCLIDLSGVQVFGDVGIYSALLIVQKHLENATANGKGQLVRIQGLVGSALQACLEHRQIETPYYSVFEVDQDYFSADEWQVVGRSEGALRSKLLQFHKISDFFEVRQGFVSGADDVFILDKRIIPKAELSLYIDYLPDRMIEKYLLPTKVPEVFLDLVSDGESLDEQQLQEQFPWTWHYLERNRDKLQKRLTVLKGQLAWWKPTRPRNREILLSKKIVCPHLMLTPRFGIDLKKRFAISRSPFLVAKKGYLADEHLKFFCAVLNSSICQWFIQSNFPKYSRGYSRVEVGTIQSIPVPDPATADRMLFNAIVDRVDDILSGGMSLAKDEEIDVLTAKLFNMSPEEVKFGGSSNG